jgi:EmrB/QacA subfamily drug resistance transporter
MNATQLEQRSKMWILVGVLLGMFVAALDTFIVSPALPQIIGDLKGMEYYAWPFTAYILCMAATVPVFGRLADMLGFKPVYAAGMLTFLAGSALCGAAQTMMQLIVFRGVQGLGAGMLTANSLAIIGATFAPAERAKYIGLGSSVAALASIVGPLIGGVITDHLTWRWVFYVNIPVGLVTLLVILITLPRVKERVSHKIDFVGIVFFVAAIVPLLLALTWGGNEYEWGSPQIIGLLAGSAVMVVAFVLVERRVAEPILPMEFFRNPIFVACSAGMVLSTGISIGTVVFVPLFMQGVLGATATYSGSIITPLMLGFLVTAAVGGALMSKTLRYKAFALLGFLVMGVGVFLLSRVGIDTSRATMLLYMVIVGAGMGLAVPVFSLAAQNAVPQNQVGSVTSLVQFFRLLGSTLFSAVLGTVMSTALQQRLAGVTFPGLPEQVTGFLQDPQAIANPDAIGQVTAVLPAGLLATFEQALALVRAFLAESITSVWTIGIFIAVAGLLAALLLKEIPLRQEILKEEPASLEPATETA